MRWIVLLLGLSACTSRWTSYEVGEKARAQVIDALRSADGAATLISGSRSFLVRHDALRKERRDFTDALARAAEAQPPPRASPAPRDVETRAWSSDSEEVVSMSYFVRVLTMDRLYVESKRDREGVLYVAFFEKSSDTYHMLAIRGTPETNRAWQHLVARARSKAVPAPRLSIAATSFDLALEIPRIGLTTDR